MSDPARLDGKVSFGEFELDLETAELRSNAGKATLPGKPFQILVALLGRPGQLITREELKRKLWPSDTFVDFDISLNKAVNRLRHALGDSAESPRYIETLPRKGYRFVGSVGTITSTPSLDPRSTAVTPAVVAASDDPAQETTPRPTRTPLTVAVLRAFYVGDWRVDPSLRTLNGVRGELHLEPKHMQVLELLAEHAGQVVSKERLIQTVWAGTFVGDEVLSTAISELRRVFHDDPEAPRFIQTIPKGGYRLIASVRIQDPAAIAEATALGSIRKSHGTRPWRKRALWGTLILAGAVGTWLVERYRHGHDVPPPMTVRPLVTLPGIDSSPAFSPDGTRITFAWTPPQAGSRIVVKMADDEPVQELTRPSVGSRDGSPAWSPDGRLIAFARNCSVNRDDADGRSGIYVIPAIGGPERRVYAGQVCHWGGPTWAPDGRTLVFTAIRTSTEHCSLYRLSLDTPEIERLMPSEAPDLGRADPGAGERMPAFSPDGKTIAFIHNVGDYAQDVYLIPSQGGAPRRLTFDNRAIWGPVAWTPDSLAILFESSRGGAAELWRVPARGGQPERLSVAENASGGVALDREGRRLAYGVRASRIHISAFDLRNPGEPPVRIAESTRSEFSPSFSSDGNRIAFASDRAGDAYDLWVADADGTNQTRLTSSSRGENGSPRWSPDDEWLAYDSSVIDGQFDICVIRVSGGAPRRLTFDRSNEYGPSWSRDGRWLYFASDRTGTDQIYKMPMAGGRAVQITKEGGFPGVESADGKFLYYSKGIGKPGVWRVPIDGGLEEPVIPAHPTGQYYRDWALVNDGIYYLDMQDETLVDNGSYYLDTQNEKRPWVAFLRFATDRAERVLELPTSPSPRLTAGLAVSPNHRRLLASFNDLRGSEIFLVENFR
jgi:Tol biopolymer transport system component/DNA-binding winged helix-turn-helix (wHTH) protein